MTKEEYLQLKIDNLMNRYGHISKPLMAKITQEAEEKFGKTQQPSTLDALIAEKCRLCRQLSSTPSAEPSLLDIMTSHNLFEAEPSKPLQIYQETLIDYETGKNKQINYAYIKEDR